MTWLELHLREGSMVLTGNRKRRHQGAPVTKGNPPLSLAPWKLKFSSSATVGQLENLGTEEETKVVSKCCCQSCVKVLSLGDEKLSVASAEPEMKKKPGDPGRIVVSI